MRDKTVFKRTQRAAWSVRFNSTSSVGAYAYHDRCRHAPFNGGFIRLCSWFISDTPSEMGYNLCHSCYMTVPDYIQTVVRLYEGR